MAFDPISEALSLGKSIINKIWPDPIKRAEEYRKLEELHQKGDLAVMEAQVKLLLGQLEVNKAEASHGSVFVAGWRPFVGWVGGASLLYTGLLHPLLGWTWALLAAMGTVPMDSPPPPELDTALLGTIVTGMLGIGGMRSFDKNKGVQTNGVVKK